MKRYVEVSKFTGGRTITQRYPARSVDGRAAFDGDIFGVPLHNSGLHDPDYDYSGDLEFTDDKLCCKGCGYVLCACPIDHVAPAPPADVLPDGWRALGISYLMHDSDALVRQDPDGWRWWLPQRAPGYDSVCEDPMPTRELAMAAALASVQPAEPVLRPGWALRPGHRFTYDHESGGFVSSTGTTTGPWLAYPPSRVYEGDKHPTLEAACLRAEELAGAS